MSKKSQARKDKKDFIMPMKLIEEELQRSMDAVRNYQFLIACIIYQAGGVLEIRQETKDYVSNTTSLNFADKFDEKRKVHVFRVKFGPQNVQEEEEEEEDSLTS